MKRCQRCKTERPLEGFHNDTTSPDGKRKVCKTCRKEESKRRYDKHGERLRAESKVSSLAYYYSHREMVRAKMKTREKAYGPRRNALRRAKRLANPEYRIVTCLRARLGGFVTGKDKGARTLELLGCTLEQLRVHLETLWLPGMNWENHGFGDDKWHIDHKRPCASFDLTDVAQQRICFHWSNLQPMWALDNLSKGAKHEGTDHNARNS